MVAVDVNDAPLTVVAEGETHIVHANTTRVVARSRTGDSSEPLRESVRVGSRRSGWGDAHRVFCNALGG
jgi:hypothetical protein